MALENFSSIKFWTNTSRLNKVMNNFQKFGNDLYYTSEWL